MYRKSSLGIILIRIMGTPVINVEGSANGSTPSASVPS